MQVAAAPDQLLPQQRLPPRHFLLAAPGAPGTNPLWAVILITIEDIGNTLGQLPAFDSTRVINQVMLQWRKVRLIQQPGQQRVDAPGGLITGKRIRPELLPRCDDR